jgi:hypothetical protein
METITLIKNVVVRHDHWMTPGRKPTIMRGVKVLEVPSISAVKMTYTARCLFSSDTYDVVLFDGKRFKLSYDLASRKWTAIRTVTYGPEANDSPTGDGNYMQVGCYKDWTEEAKSELNGWELVHENKDAA